MVYVAKCNSYFVIFALNAYIVNRNPIFSHPNMNQREKDYKELTTIVKLLERSVRLFGNNTLMMEKQAGQWREWTYAQIRDEARHFAAGLMQMGYHKGDRIALLAEGRKDWLVAELGMMYIGVINVPLSVKLDPATEVTFRLNHSGSRMIIVSRNQAPKMLQVDLSNSAIETVLYFDEVPADGPMAPLAKSYAAVCTNGVQWLADPANAQAFESVVAGIEPDDLANISYTSGTTADPKGIMLSQRNYVANAMQACCRVTIPPEGVTLSILPWDHSFAHTVCIYCFMYYGARVAAQDAGRSPMEALRNIPLNIKEVRPTLMMSVPALSKAFRKNIEGAIRSKGKVAWQMFSFFLGVNYKYNGNWFNRGKGWRMLLTPLVALGNKLIFNKVKENFGGRLKHFIGGGALLDIELQRFFAAVGIPITQGYGLSEASPVISTNSLDACKFGSSGKIVGFMDLKICDADGNELPRGQKGEIVIKGDNVMKGYWRNESASADSIRNGWLYTGDMGYVDQDDFLYVLGRFKSLLISSDGEKYSPEGIEESIVELSDCIDQCMIYNNQSPFTVGVVVPNVQAIKRYVAEAGHDIHSPEAIDLALSLIGQQLAAFRKGGEHESLFPSRWIPAAVAILPEPMTEQNKMINSTMKMVRNRVTEVYKSTIDSLFTPERKDFACKANRDALAQLLAKN